MSPNNTHSPGSLPEHPNESEELASRINGIRQQITALQRELKQLEQSKRNLNWRRIIQSRVMSTSPSDVQVKEQNSSLSIRARLYRAYQWLGFVPAWIVIIATSYLFIAGLAYEDKEGYRTLGFFRILIMPLRALGRILTGFAEWILKIPISVSLAIVLVILVGASLILLRKYRPQTWQHDIALAMVIPFLAATCLLILRGDLGSAMVTGLLTGVCLLVLGAENGTQDMSPVLVALPLGIGLILRFYALAEVPNGYAQHAVVHHVELSIPYFEALSASLHTHRFQPFLQEVSHALFREQFGFSSLVAAIGFKLFGVTLTVTRLVSAGLGTLTIYIAYRLGRALDSVRLGILFSFLLAVSPWHITLSRYGDQEHVLSPLQFLLSLLFLIRAVNGGRVRDILFAAFFTSLAWYIYGANLAILAITGIFLFCRAAMDPRLVVREWKKVLLGIGCFVFLSYVPVLQLFPDGLLGHNIRTGYQGIGASISDFQNHLQMIEMETDQLFRHADDPWFAMPRGGLGVLQSALLLPGIVLTIDSLRHRHHRDLALLVLIGIPIAVIPAILAPDPSFRRLMLVATLAALVSAFVLLRLAETACATVISGKALAILACVGAIALAALGTFGYFDQVVVGEELNNAWRRRVGAAVSGLLGREPLIVVLPEQENLKDTDRYIKLMAYNTLLDAQLRGVPKEALYLATSCEDPIDRENYPAMTPPPYLIMAEGILEPNTPCGPDFVSRLRAHYPESTVVIITPSPLPADLIPTQP